MDRITQKMQKYNKQINDTPDKITKTVNYDEIELVQGTGELLHDVSSSGRVNPWSEHKQNNVKMAEHIDVWHRFLQGKRIMSPQVLQRFKYCADTLTFKVDSEGNKRLMSAFFCKNKLCTMCNWRRSKKMYSQVTKINDAMQADNVKARYLFLTLTIKNVAGDELKSTIDKMNKAFSSIFTKRSNKYTRKVQANLLGCIKCVEVTFNINSNTFHPHFHVILAVKPSYFNKRDNYVTQEEYQCLWRRYLKIDYNPQVNIKAVQQGTRKNVVAEMAKYPVKFNVDKLTSDKHPAKIARMVYDYVTGTHKKRMVEFYGIFKKYQQQLKLDDIENGDLIQEDSKSLDDVLYLEMYNFNIKYGVYIC